MEKMATILQSNSNFDSQLFLVLTEMEMENYYEKCKNGHHFGENCHTGKSQNY